MRDRAGDATRLLQDLTSRAVARGRTRAALALRAKVAGDDADRSADRIWGTPGERWFGPDDVIWRVHADAAMFAGGIRALLLQSLHPLAMAGVARHSGYRSDPWGRLQRTSSYIATTTYGTVEHAERMIRAVRRVHETVVGTADDGRPYAAGDPELLRWVHVAEADSFLTAYEVLGPGRLSDTDRDEYVRQTTTASLLLGATDLPQTHAELQSALEGFRPQLHATPAAREAARFLLLTPPLPPSARAGYTALAVGAVATLPPWARCELGLRAPLPAPASTATTTLGRGIGRAATSGARWIMADPAVANASRSESARRAGRG
ncbi:oxygenase MpaB family protein [Arsenicicoccus dermatophilus]|uniref:oxygenase MpaB family protein n=1 Tax=Arsenicicoccus dermatophilus TaxID=1076331 RepID=UPI0039171668